MKKLPLLTAAAGLATIFGVGNAKAQCVSQECIPETDINQYAPPGDMFCYASHEGDIAVCTLKSERNGAGAYIVGTKTCKFTYCDNQSGPFYYRDYWDYIYYGGYGGYGSYCYYDCPAE